MTKFLPPLGFKDLDGRKTIAERRGSLPVNFPRLAKSNQVTSRQNSLKLPSKTFKEKISQIPKPNMFKEKLGNLTTRSEPEKEEINLPTHTITLQILSNHGNNEKITCSRIDILDKNSQPIQLVQYLMEPNRINSPDLINMFSGDLVKSENHTMWSAEWPPKGGILEIRITLQKGFEAAFIRHWPDMQTPDANMKDIMIFQDDVLVYKGSLNITTGHILNIKKPEEEKEKEMNSDKLIEPVYITDKFGIVPFKKTKRLIINIRSCYNGLPKWGVSHFKIFDYRGKEFDYKHGITIRIENSGIIESLDLFNKDNATVCDFNPDSHINFTFENPVHIGAILIYNHYDSNPSSNCGICHASVAMSNGFQWSGKVPMRLFNQEKWRPDDPYPIFFIDSIDMQKKVYSQF